MNNFTIDFKKIASFYNCIGANIVVFNQDKILESDYYGYSNLENKVETSEDTIYRIASISKTIASIGLMMLVQEKKLDLDNDISNYLGYPVRNPYYPKTAITVKMLTLQLSSIQDGYDDENPEYDNIVKGYNGVNIRSINVPLKEILTNKASSYYTNKTWGNYKPGTKFCYSNFGCGIMACIIEKVSGEYFSDYMESHLFKPLGIDASYKACNIKNQENIANMYSITNNSFQEYSLKEYDRTRFINSPLKRVALGDNYLGAAGGLFISMKDLSKLAKIYLNYGTVDNKEYLTKDLISYMYQMWWCGNDDNSYKAKAIQMRILDTFPQLPFRGHTGSAYGVRSYLFFSLKYKLGVAFITNGITKIKETYDKTIDDLFKETQKLWINTYIKPLEEKEAPTKVIFTKEKIILPYREIRAKDLYLNDNYIKAISFFDALNIIPTINNNDGTIKNIQASIYQNDTIYINLIDTLKLLNLKYEIANNKIIAYYNFSN